MELDFSDWCRKHGWSHHHNSFSGRYDVGCFYKEWNVDYYGLTAGKFLFSCRRKKDIFPADIYFEKPFSDDPDNIEKSLFEQLDQRAKTRDKEMEESVRKVDNLFNRLSDGQQIDVIGTREG